MITKVNLMETVRILGSLIGISKLNNFEKINKELIPIIEKDICPPKYRDKYYKSHQNGFAFTSDKAGQLDSFESLYGDQLQLNKKFNNFFIYKLIFFWEVFTDFIKEILFIFKIS